MVPDAEVIWISIKVLQEAVREIEDQGRLLNDLKNVFMTRVSKKIPFTHQEMKFMLHYISRRSPMDPEFFEGLIKAGDNWNDCCEKTLDGYEEFQDLPDLPRVFGCSGCNTTWKLVDEGPNQVYREYNGGRVDGV